MELSIIIPAFNEEERLPNSLTVILDFVRSRHPETEIIVVDDGSTDRTADLVRQHPSVRLIQHPRNLGKGAAVRTGMLAATGVWRYLCDSDLSTPIEDLDRLLSYADCADVILGSRRAKGAQVERPQGAWKRWLGQAGNLLIQLMVAPGIRDTQCGFKLFHQRTMTIFRLQRSNRFGYDFEDIYLARRFHFRLKEVPVTWVNDERTKVRWIDYPRTLLELISIHVNRWRGFYPLT